MVNQVLLVEMILTIKKKILMDRVTNLKARLRFKKKLASQLQYPLLKI